MMNILLKVWGVVIFTAKRIWAQKGLTLAIVLGYTTAVALMMSIPIYADSAYQKILVRNVIASEEQDNQTEIASNEPSFSFVYRYIGSWNGLVSWENVQPVDTYLSDLAIDQIGLPLKQLVKYFRTDYFPFVPQDADAYNGSEFRPLTWLSLASLTNWQDHVEIIDGNLPGNESQNNENIVDAWINEALASEIGIQVGEIYRLLATFNEEQYKTEIQVRIAGIWQVKDDKDAFWFYKPSEFRYVILTTDEEFSTQVLPPLDGELDLALWYLNFDSSQIHSREVPSLLNRIAITRSRAGVYLPNTRLDISPEESLRQYQKAASSLMLFLIILNIPLLTMILAFIGLVGGMVITQRQNEIAVLRSRGASLLQILGFSLLESIVIGIISLAAGTFIALKISQFFGNVTSFLNFSGAADITPSVNSQALQLGLLAVILAMFAQIIPTLNASRHTIITYKQEQARQLRPPWWQRVGLDFILLIPTFYSVYVLTRQGGLGIPVNSALVVQDPFQNPLLLLVPALMIFSATLLILRFLPYIMMFIARLLSHTPSIGILAAVRHLARTTGNYHAPLMLLILTLSLSTFTATLAQTLDRHLHDQVYYEIGADSKLLEFGELPGGGGLLNLGGGGNEEEAFWVFIPVNEHLKAPGIQAAARVSKSNINISPPSGSMPAQLMGIDRVDFTQVAFWRDDFARVSLGELMNQLALTTEGVLVPRNFMENARLKPGDNLTASIYKLGNTRNIDFKIVGAFDYFPGWYPDDGVILIANLDFIFEQVGGEFPYEVWTRNTQDINPTQTLESLDDLSLNVTYAYFSPELINEAQRQPERQGLFGLLSVGFSALAFLTTLGFLLYAFFSFRKRFIELGILRAIGLSARQMLVLLGFELAFLLALGMGLGTMLGVGISNLFIPFLQVGTEQTARIPPFLVQVDWLSVFSIYALFVLLFAVALTILATLLMRMKIFQAVKLGETV